MKASGYINFYRKGIPQTESDFSCYDSNGELKIHSSHNVDGRLCSTCTIDQLADTLAIGRIVNDCETAQEVADQILAGAELAGLRALKPRLKKRQNQFFISIIGDNGFSRLADVMK